MKFLMLNLLIAITCFQSNNSDQFAPSNYRTVSDFSVAALLQGSIVMEDEVMLKVDTGSPEDPVSTIEVFLYSGDLLLEVSTCNTQQCAINLSSLAAGSYTIVVTTSSNRVFSSLVQIS